ncbi:MAG: AmmeMemoRadiSam system protein B [Candidatus Omnitrophica bacterium]|nr:AmmeMemoRadiSam system protein B [Candidatus Omnitrophota bacterium]
MIREPAVSGQFYPKNSKELEKLIRDLTPEKSAQKQALGAIMPHAGYIYSGRAAVSTAAKIIPKKRVIILGPNHTGFGEYFSLYPQGSWITPFGQIEVDEELASNILDKGGWIKEDIPAHKFEHSIEVELPILKYFFGDFKFVPIICNTAPLKIYREAANQIYEGIKDKKKEILIIASGDMTHYEPEPQARKKDSLAIETILNLDEENLLRRVEKEKISMCGTATVSIMLILTKLLGAKKGEVVLYQTSGDASGDYSSVVGYLGAVIS